VRQCWTLRGERPTAPYQTRYEWGYLYSALEVDGKPAAQFLCLPRVDLEMSRLFLEHLAALDPQGPSIWSFRIGRGFISTRISIKCRRTFMCCRCRPIVRNSTRWKRSVIKDRIGNTLWATLEALEEAIGEELRPIYESAERVRSLVSHGWLIDQVNATAATNSAFA